MRVSNFVWRGERTMNTLTEVTHLLNTLRLHALPEVLREARGQVGDYKWSARSQDFSCWLLCDGRSLSRAAYRDLYLVIGTSFGSDDAETFKLPDYRGRVMGGVGQGPNLTRRDLGARVGSESHLMTLDELPSHSHSGTAAAAGSHNHGGATSPDGEHVHAVSDPGHKHTITTTNDDFNNSGASPPGFSADSAGTMTWDNINTAHTGVSVNPGGSHTHALAADGDHTHAVTIGSAGGNVAHNNMQPTLFGGSVFINVGFPGSALLA
jgi:microcystin-dependent protein